MKRDYLRKHIHHNGYNPDEAQEIFENDLCCSGNHYIIMILMREVLLLNTTLNHKLQPSQMCNVTYLTVLCKMLMTTMADFTSLMLLCGEGVAYIHPKPVDLM